MSSPAGSSPSVESGRGRTFVSYAREDEAFAHALATALEARDCPVWLDRWHIAPGADWTASIDLALRTCTAFIVVLSPDAVSSIEVQSEIGIALHRRVPVVPVLYRACEVPVRLQRTQYLDVTQAPELTDDLLDRLVGALRTPAGVSSGSADPDRQARRTLLADVVDEVRERLGGLGTDVPIALGGELQPWRLSRHWHDDGPDVPRRVEPSGVGVGDVAALVDAPDVRGSLLVLGAPGSGKTTALVQIMARWAARADRDDSQPIPVLLSLASWHGDRPIAEWMVDELAVTHGVRPDRGRQWRDRGLLAPLLDGLDEVAPALQPACVDALTAYRRAYRSECLVVSSRLAEYEQLPVKLDLRAAVVLRPFEAAEICTYLVGAGRPQRWDVVRDDPALLSLATSPLLLSFMSAVPETQVAWTAPASADARRRLLLEAYVDAQTRDADAGFAPGAMRVWLRALARNLRRQGASEFLVERLQPGWLQTRRQRVAYRTGVFLATTATVMLVLWTVNTLFGWLPEGEVGRALVERLPTGTDQPMGTLLLVGLAVTLGAIAAARPSIVPIETLTWSWTRAARQGARWGRKGLRWGLVYGLRVGAIGGAGWVLMDAAVRQVAATVSSRAPLLAALTGMAAVALVVRASPERWWPTTPARRAARFRTAFAAAVVYAPVALAPLVETDWRVVPIVLGVVLAALFIVVLALVTDGSAYRGATLREALVLGAVSGAGVGVVSAVTVARGPVVLWVAACAGGGLAVGVTSVVGVTWARAAGLSRKDRARPRSTGRRRAGRSAAAAALVAVTALAAGWLGAAAPVRAGVVALHVYQTGLLLSLATAALGALCAAIGGAFMAGVLGALGGVLGGGAAGADVERRLVPNQGIHQSAVNVVVFAALGTLVIGVPHAVLNLAAAMALTARLASPADLLRLGVGSGVAVGVLAGLLPGVACLQHGVLRVVLWASRQLPLRCVRFLDLATRRRLLQRVGGRYRFIHATLRDHLCDDASS